MPEGSSPTERLLGWSMAAGAAFDLVFAAAILLFPGTAAGWLGLELPADPIYLRLAAILLAMLGAMYVYAAVDTARYRGVVLVAAVGRLAGCTFFVLSAASGAAPVFFLLGAADGALGLSHALLVGAAAGSRA